MGLTPPLAKCKTKPMRFQRDQLLIELPANVKFDTVQKKTELRVPTTHHTHTHTHKHPVCELNFLDMQKKNPKHQENMVLSQVAPTGNKQ